MRRGKQPQAARIEGEQATAVGMRASGGGDGAGGADNRPAKVPDLPAYPEKLCLGESCAVLKEEDSRSAGIGWQAECGTDDGRRLGGCDDDVLTARDSCCGVDTSEEDVCVGGYCSASVETREEEQEDVDKYSGTERFPGECCRQDRLDDGGCDEGERRDSRVECGAMSSAGEVLEFDYSRSTEEVHRADHRMFTGR